MTGALTYMCVSAYMQLIQQTLIFQCPPPVPQVAPAAVPVVKQKSHHRVTPCGRGKHIYFHRRKHRTWTTCS
jgi:hypothetical protein